MSESVICPLCLMGYLEEPGYRVAGSQCRNTCDFQPDPCVGRLIPSADWPKAQFIDRDSERRAWTTRDRNYEWETRRAALQRQAAELLAESEAVA